AARHFPIRTDTEPVQSRHQLRGVEGWEPRFPQLWGGHPSCGRDSGLVGCIYENVNEHPHGFEPCAPTFRNLAMVNAFFSALLLSNVTRAPMFLILAVVPCLAAELKPEVVQAYDRYIHDTEALLAAAKPFLWVDASPERLRIVKQGQAAVAPRKGD